MVSENQPDIAIAYYKDPDWIDITNYAKKFRVRDAGVLKVVKADITLSNRGGIFSSGVNEIPLHSHVRILGNVRGVWDTIFVGTYEGYGGDFTRAKHHLELICRGYGQRLLWDTKTHNYSNEDISYKTMIENFLFYPDTEYDTGITLETDSDPNSPINSNKTWKIEEWDMEGVYLLNWIRKVAERINYDGYIKVVDSTVKLFFTEVGKALDGSVNYPDPPFSLSHPFVGSVGVKPELSLDDIYNWILVKGGYESGRPPLGDEWSEQVMLKYDPDIWIPNNEWTTISDDDVQNHVGDYCIKFESAPIRMTDAILDISKTEESPSIDCTSRFKQLGLWMTWDAFNFWPETIRHIGLFLEDDYSPTPNIIRWHPCLVLTPGIGGFTIGELMLTPGIPPWRQYLIPLGPDAKIYSTQDWASMNAGYWCVQGSKDNFTWKIKKVRFYDGKFPASDLRFWIDGLQFKGGIPLWPSPPYPSGIPPSKDQGSIDLYEPRVQWYKYEDVCTREMAERLGPIILDLRKQPHKKVRCRKGAKIWAKPHQVVPLTVSQYKINSEEWRILELETTWKPLRTTFTLVPKSFKVSSKAYLEDELAGLIRGEQE